MLVAIYNNMKGTWRRKFNKELQEKMEITLVVYSVRGQNIQWLRHIMRRNENDVSITVLNWKPMEKRFRINPGKYRWIYCGRKCR